MGIFGLTGAIGGTDAATASPHLYRVNDASRILAASAILADYDAAMNLN